MTIARRLIILLALPLLALLGMGLFTRLELSKIEKSSRFVAEKQISSLAALGHITRSFYDLRAGVRSYLLATNRAEQVEIETAFNSGQAEVERLLNQYADSLVTGDQDRRFLSNYRDLSRDWIVGAKHAMSLGAQGRREDGVALLNGPVAQFAARLSQVSSEWIKHNEDLAAGAGRASVQTIASARLDMFLANSAVVLIAVVLGLLTFRRIVNPIQALERSVKAIAAGDYAKEVPFTSDRDETGSLARSIEVLKQGASAVDDQRWIKANASTLTGSLQSANTLEEFGQRLISGLVPLLGGGLAASYLFDVNMERLQRLAAYGLPAGTSLVDCIGAGEGLIGQCARERKVVRLTNLPPDYLHIGSSLGAAAPTQAIALPLLSADKLLGVIEVASFRPFNSREDALLEELLPMAAMSLQVLQRKLRTEELLKQTQGQARKLEEQTEELTRSQQELLAQKDELDRTNFLADSALELTKAGYWHVPLDGPGYYNSSERAVRIFGDFPAPEHRYSLAHWAEHVRLGDEAAAKITADNFEAATAGKIPVYDATYAYKRPVDGRVVWIHALGHVVKDPSGKPTDMFGVTQDITDFKRLEMEINGARQKAEEATQMKSMFLANMSHEIRTPMNAIIGLSHLALRTQLTPKQRDYVSKVHNAGTSLLAVINDILDFSKIEAGKLDLETTEFRLDEVISSVTTLTAQKAHEKGLEFLAHVAPGIPEVLLGDPLRLGQILTNFVNNAVKFTEHGEIRLEIGQLERTGEKVQLKFSVRDSGIGMTKEQASKLFQPFTQADMSTTRKHGGTGLGLTICRRLVELMGGRIWLESEAGTGTTFYFTVWIGVGSPTGSRKIPERLEELRALVVDDNPAAREILQEPLCAVASRVDAVGSGREAIAAIQQHDQTDPYDIIFMDWRMPGMDGLQASRHIKSDETLKHPPRIVLVTAFGREEVREEAERLELDGFLIKPVTKSMIVDTLVNVFAQTPGDSAVAGAGNFSSPLPGARILLCEDNDINQQIAVELLEGAGAEVKVANNGREAVEILSNGPEPPPFDLVLMDLQMPEMDGYQATARLRADPRFATLPIIAMTAHATMEERQRCLVAGMNDHISKPIDPTHLFETVGRFFKPAGAKSSASSGSEPVASSPSGSRERSAECLPFIAGLDTKDGFGRVGGNGKLYLKLLGQFAEQQSSTVERVTAALNEGDIALAERLAHTLKGVAGNIGAKRVQAAAGGLENVIRTRAAASEVDSAKQQVVDALEPLITELQATLSSQVMETSPHGPSAGVASIAETREAAAQLERLLSESDPLAADFIETHQATLSSLFENGVWRKFEKLVQGYSFTHAQVELDLALKKPPAI